MVVARVTLTPDAEQVLFEAVGLVILLERDRELVEQMAMQLGRFIAAKEPNTRCACWHKPRYRATTLTCAS